MLHSEKNNHPIRLEEFLSKVDPDSENPFVTIQFPTGTFDEDRLNYAILKTAYLLVFEKFGYVFILDPAYDIVREQLLNFDQKIYPVKFWQEDYFPKKLCGVNFITEKEFESIMVVFTLKTNHTERVISATLPLPFNCIEDVLVRLEQKIEIEKGTRVESYHFNPGSEYLTEIDDVKITLNWIDARR